MISIYILDENRQDMMVKKALYLLKISLVWIQGIY